MEANFLQATVLVILVRDRVQCMAAHIGITEAMITPETIQTVMILTLMQTQAGMVILTVGAKKKL